MLHKLLGLAQLNLIFVPSNICKKKFPNRVSHHPTWRIYMLLLYWCWLVNHSQLLFPGNARKIVRKHVVTIDKRILTWVGSLNPPGKGVNWELIALRSTSEEPPIPGRPAGTSPCCCGCNDGYGIGISGENANEDEEPTRDWSICKKCRL